MAWRSLGRSPLFTVVAVRTLAFAIGVSSALFNVVDTVLLDRLSFADPERLVVIRATAPESSELSEEFLLAEEFLLQFQESELLEGVALANTGTSSFRLDDETERNLDVLPDHRSLRDARGAPRPRPLAGGGRFRSWRWC